MDTADRAEAESIRRFEQLSSLGHAVAEAVRRADAHLRLEHALRYGLPSGAGGTLAPRRAA